MLDVVHILLLFSMYKYIRKCLERKIKSVFIFPIELNWKLLIFTVILRFRSVYDIWDLGTTPDCEITNRFWIFIYIIWRSRTHQRRIRQQQQQQWQRELHIMENGSNWTYNQVSARKRLLKRERTNYSFDLLIKKINSTTNFYLMEKKISKRDGEEENKKKGNCIAQTTKTI